MIFHAAFVWHGQAAALGRLPVAMTEGASGTLQALKRLTDS